MTAAGLGTGDRPASPAGCQGCAGSFRDVLAITGHASGGCACRTHVNTAQKYTGVSNVTGLFEAQRGVGDCP